MNWGDCGLSPGLAPRLEELEKSLGKKPSQISRFLLRLTSEVQSICITDVEDVFLPIAEAEVDIVIYE